MPMSNLSSCIFIPICDFYLTSSIKYQGPLFFIDSTHVTWWNAFLGQVVFQSRGFVLPSCMFQRHLALIWWFLAHVSTLFLNSGFFFCQSVSYRKISYREKLPCNLQRAFEILDWAMLVWRILSTCGSGLL